MPDDLAALPPVLTVEEAAKVLRISRGAAYEAVRTNALPHVRIGRTIRVPRAGLLDLLAEGNGDSPAGRRDEAQQHDLASVERASRRGGAGGQA